MSYAHVFILDILSFHTVLILMFLSFRSAKPRPSKKARLNKPADEDVAVEPEKTPDPEETNVDAMLNDPPLQYHAFVAEQAEVDTTSHADQPTSPV